MKFIVYDTETTGLPQSKFVKPSLTELWPYIVQFSYIMYDSESNCLEKKRLHSSNSFKYSNE